MPEQQPTKPPHKLRLVIISVVIAVISGILLMGIPGGLVLELIDLSYAQLGKSPIALKGDQVWPTAIMISMLWPLPLMPLTILYHHLFPQKGLFSRWFFCLFGSMVLTVIISFILFL